MRRGVTGRLIYQKLCACGQLISRTAARCFTCYIKLRSEQQKARRTFRCLGCGQESSRRKCPGHDARKYCSRACAFAHWSEIRLSDVRSVRARARPRPTHPCRRCDRPIELRKQLCVSCREVARWDQADRRRQKARQRPKVGTFKHTCPSCGDPFVGLRDAVFCSHICSRRARKVTKGMGLSRLPINERERVAPLVALVRQANQRIDRVRRYQPLP